MTTKDTNIKCPNCGNNLIEKGLQMMDATKLYCENCKNRYIQDWRTGTIKSLD